MDGHVPRISLCAGVTLTAGIVGSVTAHTLNRASIALNGWLSSTECHRHGLS